MINRLSLLFKALGEPVRLRIVHRLLHNGREAYGEELARALGIPAYQVCRHLKVLTACGLVRERREGRWVYYSVARDHAQLVRTLRRLLNAAAMGPGSLRRRARGAASPRTAEIPPWLSAAQPNGHGHREPRERGMAPPSSQAIDWNAGPAIPGVL